jgi:hypothetical protein
MLSSEIKQRPEDKAVYSLVMTPAIKLEADRKQVCQLFLGSYTDLIKITQTSTTGCYLITAA